MRPNYLADFKMNPLKLVSIVTLLTTTVPLQAGGLLTNTNQNIAFNRNFARDGAIGIDGVYSNPAGVAFLSKGFHLSFNVQNVYQTRTIESGFTIPSLQGTPYYKPFKLNGGNEDGIKKFVGKASVPILPTFQAALNYDRWGFQMGFSLNGGGGKCTFNDGLGSFERSISMIPALLYTQGLGSNTPAYHVDSYIKGQQYVFGVQLGSTYKINDHLAAYAGFRFNYVYNKYIGNITNITANLKGNDEPLYKYFGQQASNYSNMSFYYKMRATEMTDPTQKATYLGYAQKFAEGAERMEKTQEKFADKYLDCTQTGWGITPIVGLDFKSGRWNVATRLEFTTHFNIENNTRRDDTGLFRDGVNTPNDLPGLWATGATYSILDNWRVMGSFHYYFDKNAKMPNNKQELLGGNTVEYLAGTEWDITKDITVSCGCQRTQYDLADGSYLNDMSFVTSSNSFGFGAKVKVAKNASINIAYFFTNYEHKDKSYKATTALGSQPIELQYTDDFTRTNKVLGVGLDIDF